MKTLDIFTDASVLGKVDVVKGNRVCGGAVSVINDMRDTEYHCVIDHATNNYGELTGLYLAVQLAAEYKDVVDEFNIYSDSNISVSGLKSWIYNWVNRMDRNGIMYTSSGVEVANQNIIKNIVDFILSTFDPNRHQINFIHCKSHVRLSSMSSLQSAYNCLSRNYSLVPDDLMDKIPYIQKWNNYIDESTRASLIRMQYGVDYKLDEGKYIPALFDPSQIYPTYLAIVRSIL